MNATPATARLAVALAGVRRPMQVLLAVVAVTGLAMATLGQIPPGGAPTKIASGNPPATAGATSRPAVDYEAKRKAEKEHQAALAKAKGEALPYWQEIIKKYAKSPRCEQAQYNIGVILCDLAEAGLDATARPVSPDKTEQLWKDAALALAQFTKEYPKSPSAGDAYVRQIDIALERMFSLDLAKQLSAAAVDGAKTQLEPTSVAAAASPAPWQMHPLPAVGAELRYAAYQTYLRAGLVAYLGQQYEDAQRLFELAQPFMPPRGTVLAAGRAPTGLERVIEVARNKSKLTPDEVLSGDARATLLLQLADIYYAVESFDKATALCDVLITDGRRADSEQLSWAYYNRARAWYALDIDAQTAKADYLLVTQKSPKAPWAGDALFLAANIAFNHGGKIDEAVSLWQSVVTNYPKCEEAERSAYYIGIAYEASGRWAEADKAYKELKRTFPGSEFTDLANTHLADVKTALENTPTSRPERKTK
jgi:tetratricopeptide (TPR) repeat protein